MKPEDRKRLKQHIEMIVEHRMPIVFCPNCEKYVECIHTAELYECKECGEDFARYIVSRKPANSDVSMTQDVLTDIKTPRSIENTNPDYYKDELYLDEDFRMLAKTYPADVSAIGVTTLIDYVEAVEAENARLTASLHYANTVCMEQKHVIDRLNAGRRWIPVSEKLPEMYHPVLTMAKKAKYPRVLSREKGADDIWVWALRQLGGYVAYIGEKNITHWMPLPEPPESEG